MQLHTLYTLYSLIHKLHWLCFIKEQFLFIRKSMRVQRAFWLVYLALYSIAHNLPLIKFLLSTWSVIVYSLLLHRISWPPWQCCSNWVVPHLVSSKPPKLWPLISQSIFSQIRHAIYHWITTKNALPMVYSTPNLE